MDIKGIIQLLGEEYSPLAIFSIISVMVIWIFITVFVKEIAKKKAKENYDKELKLLDKKHAIEIENLKNKLQAERDEKATIFKERLSIYKNFMSTVDKLNLKGSEFILSEAKELMLSYFEIPPFLPGAKELERQIQIEFNRKASNYIAELTGLQASLHSQLSELLLVSSSDLKNELQTYKEGLADLISYSNGILTFMGTKDFRTELMVTGNVKMENLYAPYAEKIKELKMLHTDLIDLIREELNIPN